MGDIAAWTTRVVQSADRTVREFGRVIRTGNMAQVDGNSGQVTIVARGPVGDAEESTPQIDAPVI